MRFSKIPAHPTGLQALSLMTIQAIRKVYAASIRLVVGSCLLIAIFRHVAVLVLVVSVIVDVF